MTGELVFTDLSAVDALREYAADQGMRGKGMIEVMRKVMRYWVSFHLAKVPRGDRAKVRDYMMRNVAVLKKATAASQLPAGASKAAAKRAANVDALRGTVAARIVAGLNIYSARSVKSPSQFYQLVKRFIARREFATNVHRAGSLKALRALKVPRGGRIPNLKEVPGDYREDVEAEAAEILVENWASARANRASPNPKGITGLAGDSFERALTEVDRLFARFVSENRDQTARRLGFTVSA